MRCPVCKCSDIRVSGVVKQRNNYNHRYLKCEKCGSTFQTVETIIPDTTKERFYENLELNLFKDNDNTADDKGRSKK